MHSHTRVRDHTITNQKRKKIQENTEIFHSHFGSLFPRVCFFFISCDIYCILLWFIFIAFIFGCSWLLHSGASVCFCIMYNVALKLRYLIQLIESSFFPLGLDEWICVWVCDQWNWLEYLAIYCYIYINMIVAVLFLCYKCVKVIASLLSLHKRWLR